jgi:hypothetical protein
VAGGDGIRACASTRLLATLVLALASAPASAARVDSDLGANEHGGGCYPPGVVAGTYDLLNLVDPAWAPVASGMVVDAEPVVLHGTVVAMHGDVGGGAPGSHGRSDYVAQVVPDAADQDRLATGNGASLGVAWEAGAYPEWAWASPGDRVVALGRWVFECRSPATIPGHCSTSAAAACGVDTDCRPPACPGCGPSETCEGEHFGYPSALHPPQALAVVRSGRGEVLAALPGAPAVPVTRADVFVSAEGGGAGDRCVLTHQPAATDLLGIDCFPLAQPVALPNAHNLDFEMPLPPRPPGARLKLRVLPRPAPGGPVAVPATVQITKKLRGGAPHLHVRVRMKRRVQGALPTGYAATILAGWSPDPTPLTHVRVTVQALVVNNALEPVTPSVPRECATSGLPCETAADCDPGEACLGQGPVTSWRMQAAVNGQWQVLHDLGTVESGAIIAEDLTSEQYLPAGGVVRVVANGVAEECAEARAGTSFADAVTALGLLKTLTCLAIPSRSPGEVDVAYPAPDFGAGAGGSADYETLSTGGAGGYCSLTSVIPCVVDDDCPPAETCAPSGGAFSLRYRIERLP